MNDWEEKINRLLKSDSRKKYEHITKPMKMAMHALDQMSSVHGKPVFETHGFIDGFIVKERLGIDKWDKNHEYKIWLKNALLQEETHFNPDNIMTETEWKGVELYAIEEAGIDEKLVRLGNIFRKAYRECSLKKKCIKRDNEWSVKIDNKCRRECQNISAEKSDFFTIKELDELRKKGGTYV